MTRKTKRTRKTGRHVAKVAAKAPAVTLHPLIAMAQAEPDVRRKRFYAMLARVLPHLSPDDLSLVEPILHRAYGRAIAEHVEETIPPVSP